MEQHRVTIKDIAKDLGVSTATVSNVIHGKTKKISERTVNKVRSCTYTKDTNIILIAAKYYFFSGKCIF